jgi:hypothetical protein
MKESALMKEQNQGLALELNGLSFKPAMNPTSLALAATMKSLKDRLPGMTTKKETALAKRREEVQNVSFFSEICLILLRKNSRNVPLFRIEKVQRHLINIFKGWVVQRQLQRTFFLIIRKNFAGMTKGRKSSRKLTQENSRLSLN